MLYKSKAYIKNGATKIKNGASPFPPQRRRSKGCRVFRVKNGAKLRFIPKKVKNKVKTLKVIHTPYKYNSI